MLEFAQRAVLADIPLSFDAKALQEFVLVVCQDTENGGLRDKPDKSVSSLLQQLFVVVLLEILLQRFLQIHYEIFFVFKVFLVV